MAVIMTEMCEFYTSRTANLEYLAYITALDEEVEFYKIEFEKGLHIRSQHRNIIRKYQYFTFDEAQRKVVMPWYQRLYYHITCCFKESWRFSVEWTDYCLNAILAIPVKRSY
ncbi:hypothetical protein EDEG_03218 [Edhazardia aedis USNM 41457]|uniref:Uncharacterized protein n=1 Tax=Edhazardia aedis (strain USNM 41457) TaxID=1003232 RepID=J9D479_EDHAE|nr:hypothetical protein EDEG_03218 [Edhazardia aedis USNM 41457]|eukprot:EJW02359.1 hypothetical protein EDEG_03218 [Edhazardia aedis USNM 41457]